MCQSILGKRPGLRSGVAVGLAAVWLWLGSGAAEAQKPSLADLTAMCGVCHGEDGNSKLELTPSLAGQPAFFILNQLFLMREGVRKVEAMREIVKGLTDEDLQALSEHFAKLPAKRTPERIDADLAKAGAAISVARRCASCHLPTFAGQEQMPRLAGQRIDYMIAAMKAYRDNTREGADTAMTAMVVGASDADLAALAHYAAGK